MRFGRKRSNWSNPARMFWGDRGDESNGAATLAPEEQAALRADLETDGPELDDSPMFTPEPTERLLSTLGKFQRQLSKAENGAGSEEWTDECIDQIIQGIEIAHQNGWDAIQEALTDTARVLQSYENVDRAADAVPFLHDSYEILCLIVGDIIVDNVGQSVVNKWRQRYQRALEELDSAGIVLVDDDGEAPEQSAAAPMEEEEVAASSHDAPLSNDWEAALAERGERFAPDAPWDDEVAETEKEAANDPPQSDFGEADEDACKDAHVEEETIDEEEDGFILPALSEELSVTASAQPEAEVLEMVDEQEAFQDEEEAEAAESVVSDDAHQDAPETEPAPETDSEMLEGNSAPIHYAEDDADDDEFDADDQIESAEALDAFDAVADPVSPESAALHQETLFDFDDADDTESESLESETLALVEKRPEVPTLDTEEADMEAADATLAKDYEVPEPDAPAMTERAPAPADFAPHPDSPEALLLTVQQAMAQGDVAYAKSLALKLAAQMAEMEVAKAQNTVQDAESLLAANRDAIAEAEAQVAAAETALKEMEEAIAARQTDGAKQREEMEKLRGEMSGVETEIASIEGRIRELEEQRDAEKAKLAELESTLNDQQAEESRIQTDLEALAEAEQNERERLEDARTGVGQLEQERNSREAAVAEAERLLETRKTSAGEIARTLHPAEGA